jgi:hypothetical protein
MTTDEASNIVRAEIFLAYYPNAGMQGKNGVSLTIILSYVIG